MIPKEKAENLIKRFKSYAHCDTDRNTDYKEQTKQLQNNAKQCALIAVNECIKMLEGLHKPEYVLFDIYGPKQYSMEGETDFNGYTMNEYFEQVKIEINKL